MSDSNDTVASTTDSPFHPGELAVQERLGVAGRAAPIGRQLLRDYMPDQHREFFAQLPFVLLGTLDAGGQPRASILCAPPGFAQSPDPRRLELRARPLPGDPLATNLRDGAPIALLGIEPPTRRRNRMNGVVTDVTTDGFAIRVLQSFGNCPKYIQARDAHYDETLASTRGQAGIIETTALDTHTHDMIAAADTCFIASAFLGDDGTAVGARGVDVSHRGGRPGFVRRVDARTLLVPDFSGNNLFNTFGNLLLEPRAGLLFLDFERGDLLQLAVRAEIVWDGPEVAAYRGALRALRFHVEAVRLIREVLPLRWSTALPSPFLEHTGDWNV